MIRNILALLSFGFVFACGSVDNGDLFEEYEGDAGELGTVEQAITGKVTPSFQFGTQTGSDRRKANRTTSGQVVTVPNTVTFKVCAGNVFASNNLGTFAAGRAHAMRQELDGLSSFAFNYPVAENNVIDGTCFFCFENGTCDPALGLSANIVIVKGAVGTSGTASNDIKNYASVDFFRGNGTANLAEQSGVVGQYSSHQMCRITIDEVDLLAKGTSQAQDQNLIDHAVANSLFVCSGIGRHPTATGTSQLYSRAIMNAAIDVATVSSGETCQVNGYTLTTPAQYANNATACAND